MQELQSISSESGLRIAPNGFFWRFHVAHINLLTVESFMSIPLLVLNLWELLFISNFNRSPEILNTFVWVFSNILGMKQVRDTNFGMIGILVSSKCHNNVQNFVDKLRQTQVLCYIVHYERSSVSIFNDFFC